MAEHALGNIPQRVANLNPQGSEISQTAEISRPFYRPSAPLSAALCCPNIGRTFEVPGPTLPGTSVHRAPNRKKGVSTLILHETDVQINTEASPGRRGASRRPVIEEAKLQVSTIDLATRLATEKLRRIGAEWATNCPLPDHEDRTPSFTVNAEKDVWFCYGCLRGGDVVELARFAWGYEKSEVTMAAANLLHEFGHEIPERPASWYAKQERQKPVRDLIAQTRFDHVRRRLFKRFFYHHVEAIEDPGERAAEAEILWEAAGTLTELVAARMIGGIE